MILISYGTLYYRKDSTILCWFAFSWALLTVSKAQAGMRPLSAELERKDAGAQRFSACLA
jgi:hypothetical protein